MSKLSAYGMTKQKKFVIAGAVVTVVVAVVYAVVIVEKYLSGTNTVILLHEKGAKWIRLPQETDLFARPYLNVFHGFRSRFSVGRTPEKAMLHLRAMRQMSVFINKRLVFVSDATERGWKNSYAVDIGPYLSPGTNEIYIKVLNAKGPPALLAYCQTMNIHTGSDWEAGAEERSWQPAAIADNIPPSGLSRRFSRSDRAFIKILPVFAAITALIIMSAFLLKLNAFRNWSERYNLTAGRTRLAILALGVVMALNNIGKIPLDVGMDVHQHVDYILYLADEYRVPLPTEGVQMFESPFYYMLSAAWYKILEQIFSLSDILRGLRIISILSGLIQIELCYRASRYVFPERQDLQVIATIIGGFFPMNIYMSQVVGTEPLAGVFSGGIVLLMLRFIHQKKTIGKESFFILGIFYGLALLTKITALLLLLPLVFFSIYTCAMRNETSKSVVGKLVLFIGVALIISGWYYFRNWLSIGKIFVGGWDPVRGILWWQDPGYRTPSQFFYFGESLFYPIYAGVMGFWDALYSTLWLDGQLSGIARYDKIPPWNYDYMLAGAWLSLLPALTLILGLFKTVRNPLRALENGSLLASSCLVIYLSAIFYLFLTVPIYSIVKGTYTLGLLPCYAVLGASGFEVLTRHRIAKKLGFGILLSWAFGSYMAYFVI